MWKRIVLFLLTQPSPSREGFKRRAYALKPSPEGGVGSTAWMQEVEQRMEQLPRGEIIHFLLHYYSFYREVKLGGLPPTHQSESLKTNGFQIKLAKSLSNSVACGRVFDLSCPVLNW